LSVSPRNVCLMPGCLCCYTSGDVYSLGLRLVWCPKAWRRILGGRIAGRLAALLEQFAAKRAIKDRTTRLLQQYVLHPRRFPKLSWTPAYFAVSVGFVSEMKVRRYVEHHWDGALAS
jgi:putative transposase